MAQILNELKLLFKVILIIYLIQKYAKNSEKMGRIIYLLTLIIPHTSSLIIPHGLTCIGEFISPKNKHLISNFQKLLTNCCHSQYSYEIIDLLPAIKEFYFHYKKHISKFIITPQRFVPNLKFMYQSILNETTTWKFLLLGKPLFLWILRDFVLC